MDKTVLHPLVRAEIEEAEEYKKTPGSLRWIRSQQFDIAGAIIIGFNAIVMCLELEYNGGVKARRSIQSTVDIDLPEWETAELMFLILDHMFCIVFTMELVLRIMAYRARFFWVASNWMDIIIVVSAVMELYVLPALAFKFPNLIFVRLLRLFRLVKILRIVRSMVVVKPLRLLLVSISSSLATLIWSVAFLLIIQLMSAIFLTQMLYTYIIDPDSDLGSRVEVYNYFGRFTYSMYTMFELTMAVNMWAKLGRMLIFDVNWMWIFFFASYGWLVIFAVIRVISAMFLKQTLAAAASDPQNAMAEKNAKRQKETEQLRFFFSLGDNNYDGFLGFSEFQQLLRKPEFEHMLSILGVDATDAEKFFHSLADHDADGEPVINETQFVDGIVSSHSGVKAIDLERLIGESHKALDTLFRIESRLEGGRLERTPAHTPQQAERTPVRHR